MDAFEKQISYNTNKDLAAFVESRSVYLRNSTFREWRERQQEASTPQPTGLCISLSYWDEEVTRF